MGHSLYIFDFDDTLVSSGALIRVLDPVGNEVRVMTSEEYADPAHPKKLTPEEIQLGYSEDFSEFEIYPPNAERIEQNFSALVQALEEVGPNQVVVLSARDSVAPMKDYLSDQGVSEVTIKPVGGANPYLKADYVAGKLHELGPGITDVYVFEDSEANLRAIESTIDQIDGVDFHGTLVTLHKESLLRKWVRNLIMEILG